MPNLYALFIRGPEQRIFSLAESLGFDGDMPALALSIFEDGPDTQQLQALFDSEADARSALNALALDTHMEHCISALPDEDWVALSQKGLPPVEAGRFWVYGQHDADKIPDNIPYPIRIEAGAAFGTGHHGTTKGCLLLLDKLLTDGESPKRVLDLGCGAGILAIAAAMALQKTVLATDIDPDAVAVTLENAQINHISPHIEASQADGFQSPVFSGRSFDLIFANILAGPLMALAPDIVEALEPSGYAILSGILSEQADTVSKAYIQSGLDIKKGPTLSGWTSLIGVKKSV